MSLAWNDIAAIRGMVLNEMNDTQILEVFEYVTIRECMESIKSNRRFEKRVRR